MVQAPNFADPAFLEATSGALEAKAIDLSTTNLALLSLQQSRHALRRHQTTRFDNCLENLTLICLASFFSTLMSFE